MEKEVKNFKLDYYLWLIEQAKILYPIGTKIYQLYSGGTSNKSHEITIHNHDFTIDSDGEVLYNAQYRLYTPINDTWATKVEEQPKYEVVHCKTQEEWDFVTEQLKYIWHYSFWSDNKQDSCININVSEKGTVDVYTELNYKILSFEEWLNKEGITLLKEFEVMPEEFNPNEVVKPSINFGQLNLEDWLRETKKLNLSEEKLQDYIGSSGTCSQSVGLQLKGNTVVQKAEILWNEWNGITGECTLTPQYPIRPTEAYKMISESECIKPSIIKHKAQLVEVNKKQIFKN